MSSATKNDPSVLSPMKHESSNETPMTPADVTSTRIGATEPSQIDSEGVVSRRPRNPFILFRTWYIKQGHLKSVTSSGSELSKITGKLWKAMHESDRDFWAEQARLEREASAGRPYTSSTSKSRTGRNPRKKSSGARHNPLATRAPDPIDQRMDNIVQLIIAGKSGDEIGGELRKNALRRSESRSSATAPVESPALQLIAPVPRSARASVSLDALELQSHLSQAQVDQDCMSTSLSPDASLHDLPATPEHLASGYSTPHGLASRRGSAAPSYQADISLPLSLTPDVTFSAFLRDRSGCLDVEAGPLAATPDTSARSTFQHQPTPTSHKEHSDVSHMGYQGWNYYNTSAPVHGLNYWSGSLDVPSYPNYASHDLVPTASWHGPEFVSAYDVPGHTPLAHAGDPSWPSEWVNDSY